jgi:hypothetical protein
LTSFEARSLDCVFLKVHHRSKDGKDHHYYSLVESVRTSRGPQHRTLAYLGELNSSTESAWRRSIAVFNVGLVVAKSGLPLGYEVFAGNRAEPTTLDEMMAKMEALYGKASRIWVFDRGVASERNLEALRRAGGLYLVGTPRTLLRTVEA